MRFVLIHGAASSAWHWNLLATELTRRGHEVIAPQLPCDDPAAGLAQYVDTVVNAVPDGDPVTVVAHSMAGFVGVLVCERLPVRELVLVAAMIPEPGERIGEWWGNTGLKSEEGDVFFHDLPAELAAEARTHLREQSRGPMNDPCDFKEWPERTRVVIARDDRLFPAEFLRRVTRERLGVVPDELPGAHFPMLGHPSAMADYLGA
ncbi:alpha/beta fold hydrolase [Kribbella sp. NPDC051587]|uniref:alpha/beta fold hydrolase n=1 Tax=Kribbella sp. NPDC051587 TaxID=3364119 RepID=UPI0037A4F5BA